jgi:hypothetical protein
MRQGPWTDLYSLGGTMYFLVTGEVPVAAASRAVHDDQPRLALQGARDCSPGLLAAIDWMLALKPPERPQSVHMLRDVLEGRITMPGRKAADKTMPGVAARSGDGAPSRTDIDLSDNHADTAATALPEGSALRDAATAVTVLQGPAAAAPVAPATSPPVTAPGPLTAPEPAPPVHRSPALRWVLGALLLFNLLAWWTFTRPSPSTPAVPQAAAAAVEQRAAPQVGRAITPSTAVPADSAASETILSIMPARSPPLRTAVAASAALPRPADGALTTAKPRAIPEPASSPSVAPATVIAVAGPRARCGERNFLSMLICMKSECEEPALRGHPECVKMREQEEAQRDRRQ